MVYHVIGTPFDVFTPVGVVLGAGLYATGRKVGPSLLSTAGTVGLVTAAVGVSLGCARLAKTALIDKENSQPLPWDDHGIHDRAVRVHANTNICVFDAGAWGGMALACVGVLSGVTAKRFSPGVFGWMQCAAVGAAAGSIGAMMHYDQFVRDKTTPEAKDA
jgi:hypothetical protein